MTLPLDLNLSKTLEYRSTIVVFDFDLDKKKIDIVGIKNWYICYIPKINSQ